DWKKIEDPGTKAAFYEMTAGDDITVKSADPANPQDLNLKLFLGLASRTVDPSGEDKPVILSKAELLYTDGDVTLAYDPFARRVVRTEIKRATAGANPDTANAVVFGNAVVVPITLFPADSRGGNHPAIQIAAFKPAKDTSPSSITFLMLALWILAMLAAIPLTWLANKERYTMQLGIVEKEPQVEAEEPVDAGGDVGGEPEPEGGDQAGTQKMDDEIEIS
ncbi:MAG TPA: hypothetical protein VL860_08770, partial [Planctomycetota bacterium]|nr:hypothetical protein [Planctomycetota bacterium]